MFNKIEQRYEGKQTYAARDVEEACSCCRSERAQGERSHDNELHEMLHVGRSWGTPTSTDVSAFILISEVTFVSVTSLAGSSRKMKPTLSQFEGVIHLLGPSMGSESEDIGHTQAGVVTLLRL